MSVILREIVCVRFFDRRVCIALVPMKGAEDELDRSVLWKQKPRVRDMYFLDGV